MLTVPASRTALVMAIGQLLERYCLGALHAVGATMCVALYMAYMRCEA